MEGRSKKHLYGSHVDSKTVKGKYIKSKKANNKSKDIAIDSTIRTAVLNSSKTNINKTNINKNDNNKSKINKIRITKNDLQEKVRKHKARGSIVLVIDMSGSMVSDKKINRIKSILNILIKNTIKHKDKLSVVGFKGKESEIIIPNTKYPKSFLSKLDSITIGGTTPIAIGLKRGIEVLKKDISSEEYVPMLILLSDGRPNVGLGGSPIYDTLDIAKEIADDKIHNIIIDFDKQSTHGRNFNMELAFYSKGAYYNIENEINLDLAIESILNYERGFL
ncbi:MAG: VWA domain-containing protein [Methanobrevibacter sp.]|jgi:magnesium chelatase subunit D|nr:VWA domain-containing protein [Candidatus Methanoflexus mossambicus]